MIKRPLILAAIAALLSASCITITSERKMPQRDGKIERKMVHQFAGKHHGMMMDMLKLTDEQKAKMKAIHEPAHAKVKAAMESIRAEMTSLTELYQDGKVDEAQLKSQYQKLQTALNQAMNDHFAVTLEVRKILTPEQRALFSQHHMKMMNMMPMGGMMKGRMEMSQDHGDKQMCPMCQSKMKKEVEIEVEEIHHH